MSQPESVAPEVVTPSPARVAAGLLAVDLLLRAVLMAQGTEGFLPFAVRLALLFGFLAGSDGVRLILIGLAFIGLAFSGFGVLLLVTSGFSLEGGALLALVGVLFGLLSNGYLLYALNNLEVQDWMFRRSLSRPE